MKGGKVKVLMCQKPSFTFARTNNHVHCMWITDHLYKKTNCMYILVVQGKCCVKKDGK